MRIILRISVMSVVYALLIHQAFGGISELLGARGFNLLGDQLITYNGAGAAKSTAYYANGVVALHRGLLKQTEVKTYGHLGRLNSKVFLTGVYQGQGQPFLPVKATRYTDYPAHDGGDTDQLWTWSQGQLGKPGFQQFIYTYTANGWLFSTVHKREVKGKLTIISKTVYQYSPFTHRVLSATGVLYPQGNTKNPLTYTLTESYNTQGQLTKIIDNLAGRYHGQVIDKTITIQYQYTGLGRVNIIDRVGGDNTINHYDHQGRLHIISIVRDTFSKPLLAYQITYDLKGNPRRITQIYHMPSNLIAVSSGQSRPVLSSGTHITTYYRYNRKNQLTGYNSVSHNSWLYGRNAYGSIILGKSYTYTPLNTNIQSVTTCFAPGNKIPNNLPNGRSKQCIGSEAKAIYHYTVIGHPNRLAQLSFEQVGNNPYQYLPQLIDYYHGSYHYYPNGQIMQNAHGGTYQYNWANQLIHLQSNMDAAKSVAVTYGYGLRGLLDQEQSTLSMHHAATPQSNPAGVTSVNGQTMYLSHIAGQTIATQGANLSATLTGLANLVTTPQSTRVEYLYAVLRNDIALTSQIANHKFNHIYTYTAYGQQSDLLHLLNPSQIANYDISQNRQVLNVIHNHYGYGNYFFDRSTGYAMPGLYRLYDNKIGRFIEHDSWGPFSRHQTYNGYTYVKGNPVAYIDPTGHGKKEILARLKRAAGILDKDERGMAHGAMQLHHEDEASGFEERMRRKSSEGSDEEYLEGERRSASLTSSQPGNSSSPRPDALTPQPEIGGSSDDEGQDIAVAQLLPRRGIYYPQQRIDRIGDDGQPYAIWQLTDDSLQRQQGRRIVLGLQPKQVGLIQPKLQYESFRGEPPVMQCKPKPSRKLQNAEVRKIIIDRYQNKNKAYLEAVAKREGVEMPSVMSE